jgi:predicted DNA binding protein
LRTRAQRDEERRLVVVTLRIRMARDHWLGQFSNTNPTIRIQAQHWSPVDARTSVLDYWIEGLPPGRWTREIASFPDVSRVEALAELGEGCIYRVVQRTNPVVRVYRRLGLPLKFPLTASGGEIIWEVVAKRAEFDKVLAFLHRRGLGVTILSIRRGLLRSHLPFLTAGQRHLLVEAMRAGYFAVPRGITLTDLAKRLGRSKSAVSESLAIVERKLLENSLNPAQLVV